MISTSNLSMRYGAKHLFKDVDLQFNPGCHYGLVGANGSGKSTFIKILIGDIVPESGNVHLPTQLSMGFLKQDHYLYDEEAVLNVVLQGNVKLWQALEEKKKLLALQNFTSQECDSLGKIEQVIEEQGGYAAVGQAAKLLEGLGIKEPAHSRPLKHLSGGYKLRTLLAQVLFVKPDILVLDEPTNHLDLASIKWLEGHLKNFQGTIVLSSHDRNFLNGICTHIADVDYGAIKIYKGNYEEFLEAKQQERDRKELLLAKHDKRKTEIQGFIDRFKAKASKARQAQSKARQVDRLVEEIDEINLSPSSRLYPNIKFEPFRSSGHTPLIVKNIAKSFGAKQVLENVSFEIERGDRLAIIGPNGIGKSTLLEILTNHLKMDVGSFEWGFATRIAYFPQDHGREVQGAISLLDWLGRFNTALNQEQLREILARVLFSGDTVTQQIGTLSGGETARLILAKMLMQNPNVLIFDEPTNHLDMEAIEALTESLKTFEETVIFVSHNRYFVSEVANRILEITEFGVRDFKCGYSEYLQKQETDFLSARSLQRRSAENRESDPKKTESILSYEDQKKLRGLRSRLEKNISRCEEECQSLENKLAVIHSTFSSEGFYQTTSLTERQLLIDEKEDLEARLLQAMENWEALSLELQQVQGGAQ
jgi:ATPase subunit of ABC transporter with duplicated ATPase domains